ncbi:MAG: PaaI family thioesterase [Litorilinea sp.]
MALGEFERNGYTPGDMNHAKQTSSHTAARLSASGVAAVSEKSGAPDLAEQLAARLQGGLPGHLGIELLAMPPGQMILRMPIRPIHSAANGYLHAGAVVTLADTACGFGCLANLPAPAKNFTTIELKSNFLSTALDGVIMAHATLRHGGRRTQIWDAEVRTVVDAAPEGNPAEGNPAEDATLLHTAPPTAPSEARLLALFRCTQMILYP